MQKKINSWLITQVDKGTQTDYLELDSGEFLSNEIIIEVKNSALNYKDALAITGMAPIIRKFPLIPGIDFSGVVIQSKNKKFVEGDRVFATGLGLGELQHGGLSSHASTDADILIKLPNKYTHSYIMGLGTAGLTAMLAVLALHENSIKPDAGKVLVTGSSGAVGGIATKLLLKLGYEVVAMTSRPEYNRDYLKSFGNIEVLDTDDFLGNPRMLSKERWASAIDVVGGKVLENIITETNRSGVISVCGQVLGLNIVTNLAPFI
ncbi:MAG: alcohol dehydrogenase catalytic domain-containing protein, partial [Pseudomonadota bacterium]|nr:alcohol dehydrogenase catalytic domain-containing protein [Pseudomonadota bacterium]